MGIRIIPNDERRVYILHLNTALSCLDLFIWKLTSKIIVYAFVFSAIDENILFYTDYIAISYKILHCVQICSRSAQNTNIQCVHSHTMWFSIHVYIYIPILYIIELLSNFIVVDFKWIFNREQIQLCLNIV